MGMGTTRSDERILASQGLLSGHAQPKFEHSEGLCNAGVLFILPALLEQGLLTTKEIYKLPDTHYYSLESVVLTLAFMALSRIKNPEQLKQCNPGEIGRIIGLDRVPQIKNLRNKVKLLSEQRQAKTLNNLLIDQWYGDQEGQSAFLYIDGHVRVYYGKKANLTKKHVARQKLCLSATTEYWVNDEEGLPVMVVMGQLNEKLQDVIEHQIIPQLQQTVLANQEPKENEPLCTLIFDREAYEPKFFSRLWEKYRIAVITYRKNVKDSWPEKHFVPIDTKVLNNKVTMYLSESKMELQGDTFREIRRLSNNGHQIPVLTNHPSLTTSYIAERMFGRWSQENFFRYLIQDYDFDKMVEFGVETIDPEEEVVNPAYRKLSNELKKIRGQITRIEAQRQRISDTMVVDTDIDQIPQVAQKQEAYKEKQSQLKEKEEKLLQERTKHPARIKLKEMPEKNRYNRLKTESKLLMNVIKMISYRAETSVANLLNQYLKEGQKEKRMLVKQIIQTPADLIPDEQNNTLTVRLYSLSANRYNQAANKLCQLLNETETIFPGTNLKMIFKTTAISDCEE